MNTDKQLATPLKGLIIAIYVVIIAAGTVCAALSLYVTIIALMFFGPYALYLLVPTTINLIYLTLAIRRVAKSTWRKNMYKPLVWLPLMLALPLILYGTNIFAMSLIGL